MNRTNELADVSGQTSGSMIFTALGDVRPGMLLGKPIYNREGHSLLGPGVPLTAGYIARLEQLGYWAVWIEDPDTKDIACDDILSEDTRLATIAVIQDIFRLTLQHARTFRASPVGSIQTALESYRFQQLFWDGPAIERLHRQAAAVVQEVLERPALPGVHTIRSDDMYMFHHALDVTVAAVVLGRFFRYDPETLKKLAVGCMLHDIGQVFLDDMILDRAPGLVPEDVNRLKNHASLGHVFVRDCLRLGVLSSEVAHQHHERQDETGYPRGLQGTNRILPRSEIHPPKRINPVGEIAAIADFYDSCSADQLHRTGFAPDRVWQLIRERAGSHFNRDLTERFLAELPPFPLGTRVLVTGGRWESYHGVVARLNPEIPNRPLLRILGERSGGRVDPFELDLAREEAEVRGVIRFDGDDPVSVLRDTEPYAAV